MKFPRASNIGVNTCIMWLKETPDWAQPHLNLCQFYFSQRPLFSRNGMYFFHEDYWNTECLTILCFMKHAECKFSSYTASGSLNEENLWM